MLVSLDCYKECAVLSSVFARLSEEAVRGGQSWLQLRITYPRAEWPPGHNCQQFVVHIYMLHADTLYRYINTTA